MNIRLNKENDIYTAYFTDKNYAIFSGTGNSVAEAIGGCVIANREVINLTFEINDGQNILYSTEYGQPRKKS